MLCKRFFTGLLATGGLLLATAAPAGETPFAEDDQPHAKLMWLEQGDIGENISPAVFVRVDGEPVLNPENRKFLLVEPGEHVIRLKPDFDRIASFQPPNSRYKEPPSIQLQEMDFTVELEAGMTYKIGLRRGEETSWTDFKPFVYKSWPTGEEEPQQDEIPH